MRERATLGEEPRPGLLTWTTWHAEWEQDVRGFAIVAPKNLVLVDSLLRGGQWEELAETRGGRALDVVPTIYWHARSAAELRERHPEATVHGLAGDREEIEKRTPLDATFAAGDELPGGPVAIHAPTREEVVLWDPAHAPLIAGDAILGDGEAGEGLHLRPEDWLPGDDARAKQREALREATADLPVEIVLPSHGALVLTDARASPDAALVA